MKKLTCTLLDVTDLEFSFIRQMFISHYKKTNLKKNISNRTQGDSDQQSESLNKLKDTEHFTCGIGQQKGISNEYTDKNFSTNERTSLQVGSLNDLKYTQRTIQGTPRQYEDSDRLNPEYTKTISKSTNSKSQILRKMRGSIGLQADSLDVDNKNVLNTTDNMLFRIPSTPLIIQRDLSPNTSYLLCHRPNMSRKNIFCLYKQIPILNIRAIYDFFHENLFKYTDLVIFFNKYTIEPLHGMSFFMEENDELIANYLYFLGAIRVNTVNFATDFYITSINEEDIRKKTINHMKNETNREKENFLYKNTKIIDSQKIYTNDWKIYQKDEQFHYMTRPRTTNNQTNKVPSSLLGHKSLKTGINEPEETNESTDFKDFNGLTLNLNNPPLNCSLNTSDNNSLSQKQIFKNKLFYLLPNIPQIFQPFLISFILDHGGIRTKRDTRNVDYRIGFILNDATRSDLKIRGNETQMPLTDEILADTDQNSSFLSLNFLFQCIAQGALFSPHTFYLRTVSIKRPLKDVTLLIKPDSNDTSVYKKDSCWDERTSNVTDDPDNSKPITDLAYKSIIAVNKLVLMGARIKSRFDSSVTHIISSKPILSSFLYSSSGQKEIFTNKNATKTTCNFVNMHWIDKCLKIRSLVQNKNNWKRPPTQKVSYDIQDGTQKNLEYPRVCFSNTPKSLRARLEAHLTNYQINISPIEDANYLIIGNMTLCEKILLAMVSDIKVIRACEYRLPSFSDNEDLEPKDNYSQKCSPIMLHRALSTYCYTNDNVQLVKHKKIIKALEFWKGKKPFNNWRVWIVRDSSKNKEHPDKENIQNDKNKKNKPFPSLMKNELKLLLHRIITKGGGTYSYSSKEFSYTQKISEEEGLNWIIKYLLACDNHKNKLGL